ncbi:hypothetical protein D3C87_817420 [compost metagenome]
MFEDILSTIEQVSSESQDVSDIIELVSASAHSMVEMMEGIALIAEQSSVNTQNVAAAVAGIES